MNLDTVSQWLQNIATSINNAVQQLTTSTTQLTAVVTQLAASVTQLTNLSTDLQNISTALSSPYPPGAIPVFGSATGANSSITAIVPATNGKTTYITGFTITSGGATSGAVVGVTVASFHTIAVYAYGVVAGATIANPTMDIRFPQPIPGGGANIQITVTVAAMGSGNTIACVDAYGYQL